MMYDDVEIKTYKYLKNLGGNKNENARKEIKKV